MNADSQLKRGDAPAAVGSDALAEGLMLVRASTLKMIRLQLAMERKDRRVALEAVDDLVALDRRLQDYLADVTAPELEVERAALNREKLTLAAEVIRAEPKPPLEPQLAEPVATEEWDDFAFDEVRPRRTAWWLLAVLLLLSVVAAAVYWFAGPELLGAIA
jgi:hypothetical protein